MAVVGDGNEVGRAVDTDTFDLLVLDVITRLLAKPFDPDALLQAVRAELNQRQG